MKKGSKIKVLTLVLIVVLIGLVAFCGIYQEKQNMMENIVPEYLFGMDIRGARQLIFKVDDSTTEVTYDSEGNVVEDTAETEETTTDEESTEGETEETKEETVTKQEPVNAPEILTLENYNKSKEIFENRIKTAKVTEYETRLDNQTGKIYIYLPENANTDKVVQNINGKGTFELVDAETEEVLLTNAQLEDCSAMYSSTEVGLMVYVQFSFNEEGTKKLEEISKTYVESTDEEGNTIQKKATLKVDGNELTTTYFSDPITDGKLLLTIGNETTSDEDVQEYLQQASSLETLLGSGELPIKYVLEDLVFVKSDILTQNLNILLYIAIGVFALMMLFLIIKYKKQGLAGVVSNIAFVSLLLLILRYANVVISLDGILSIVFSVLLNYIFTIVILINIKKYDVVNAGYKQAVVNFSLACIPVAIIAIAFTMMSYLSLQSFGMILFWAILLMFACSYIFTKGLLNNIGFRKQEEKEKENEIETKNSGSLLKLFLIVVLIIILIGIGMIVSNKFNIGLAYSSVKTVEINVPEGMKLQDIRNIANEVFKEQEVVLQQVEFFNDTVLLKTSEITAEQKTQLVEKINEKYNTEYTDETLIVNSISNLRLRDLIKPILIPLLITSIIIVIYACIRYKKLGIFKTLIFTIATMIVPQATYVSIIAITRLPINRITIPIALFVYALSILIFGIVNEKKIKTVTAKKTK